MAGTDDNQTRAMSRTEERAFIDRIRALHGDASTDVRERIIGTDHFLEGRIIPAHPHTPIALFDLGADYRDIAFYVQAHRAVGVLLRKYDDAVAYYRRQNPAPENRPPEGRPYSPAQNCGKWCNDRMFQRFMHEVHGLDHASDPHRMATRIRGMLVIQSRAELDTDEAAAARWHSLRSEFKAWRASKL